MESEGGSKQEWTEEQLARVAKDRKGAQKYLPSKRAPSLDRDAYPTLDPTKPENIHRAWGELTITGTGLAGRSFYLRADQTKYGEAQIRNRPAYFNIQGDLDTLGKRIKGHFPQLTARTTMLGDVLGMPIAEYYGNIYNLEGLIRRKEWLYSEALLAGLRFVAQDFGDAVWIPKAQGMQLNQVFDNGPREAEKIRHRRFLIIPLYQNSHWSLGIYDQQTHYAYYWDSLVGKEASERAHTWWTNIDYFLAMNGVVMPKYPPHISYESTTSQQGAWECGLFVLEHARVFMRERLGDTQEDVSQDWADCDIYKKAMAARKDNHIQDTMIAIWLKALRTELGSETPLRNPPTPTIAWDDRTAKTDQTSNAGANGIPQADPPLPPGTDPDQPFDATGRLSPMGMEPSLVSEEEVEEPPAKKAKIALPEATTATPAVAITPRTLGAILPKVTARGKTAPVKKKVTITKEKAVAIPPKSPKPVKKYILDDDEEEDVSSVEEDTPPISAEKPKRTRSKSTPIASPATPRLSKSRKTVLLKPTLFLKGTTKKIRPGDKTTPADEPDTDQKAEEGSDVGGRPTYDHQKSPLRNLSPAHEDGWRGWEYLEDKWAAKQPDPAKARAQQIKARKARARARQTDDEAS